MSTLDWWLTIIALSLVTLATRVGTLFLPASVELPPRLQRALRDAGPCILMAIVAPDLLRHEGAVDLGIDNIRLMAARVAVAVFLATRGAAIMIATALLALTLLRFAAWFAI